MCVRALCVLFAHLSRFLRRRWDQNAFVLTTKQNEGVLIPDVSAYKTRHVENFRLLYASLNYVSLEVLGYLAHMKTLQTSLLQFVIAIKRKLELLPPFDFNRKFEAHPNNSIWIENHFLSILDFEYLVKFNSRLNYVHPNTTIKKWWRNRAFFPEMGIPSPCIERCTQPSFY
jgi:hypothetical protein